MGNKLTFQNTIVKDYIVLLCKFSQLIYFSSCTKHVAILKLLVRTFGKIRTKETNHSVLDMALTAHPNMMCILI